MAMPHGVASGQGPGPGLNGGPGGGGPGGAAGAAYLPFRPSCIMCVSEVDANSLLTSCKHFLCTRCVAKYQKGVCPRCQKPCQARRLGDPSFPRDMMDSIQQNPAKLGSQLQNAMSFQRRQDVLTIQRLRELVTTFNASHRRAAEQNQALQNDVGKLTEEKGQLKAENQRLHRLLEQQAESSSMRVASSSGMNVSSSILPVGGGGGGRSQSPGAAGSLYPNRQGSQQGSPSGWPSPHGSGGGGGQHSSPSRPSGAGVSTGITAAQAGEWIRSVSQSLPPAQPIKRARDDELGLHGGGGGGAGPVLRSLTSGVTVSLGSPGVGGTPGGSASHPAKSSPLQTLMNEAERFRLATPAMTLRGGPPPSTVEGLNQIREPLQSEPQPQPGALSLGGGGGGLLQSPPRVQSLAPLQSLLAETSMGPGRGGARLIHAPSNVKNGHNN